jgi:hypothetical protein
MTTEPGRRPRRGHAAAGGRILVGGLSLSVLAGLIGAMARSERPATPAPPPAVAAPDAAATQVSPATRTPAAPVVPPPVHVTRPTTPPTTTSHGT